MPVQETSQMPGTKPLLGLAPFLSAELFRVGSTAVTPATLILAGSFLLLSWLLSMALRYLLRRSFRRRGVTYDEGGVWVAARLFHYFMLITGALVALNTVGVKLEGLFAAGAVFAVGVGFAMQNITQNFVSGVILLIERSIEPGDVIEVNSQMVRVHEMGIRATLVRTLDDENMIVPNSLLVQSTVKNYTHQDSVYRLRIMVGVHYASDLIATRLALEKAATDSESRLRSHEPRVLLLSFGASSLDYEVSVWIDDPWNHRIMASKLRENIAQGLKNAGIVIAFPQMDVHFDAPVAKGLSALSGRAA
jgi:small-conductance mechanosensitive channel